MQAVSTVSSRFSAGVSNVYYRKSEQTTRQTGGLPDKVTFGREPVSPEKSMGIVYERAFAKLQAVVNDARTALGIPEGAVIDTSPEATAGRIADFALGAYDSWRKRHGSMEEDTARQEFSKFIGGAVKQGITEARNILQALNALTDETDSNINSTWEIIQKRLDDFVSGD